MDLVANAGGPRERFLNPLSYDTHAAITYIQAPGATAAVVSDMRADVAAQVDYIFSNDDLYRNGMADWAYHWGSSKSRASRGIFLHQANKLGERGSHTETEILEHAQDILHFFHGQNPINMVYLTNMADLGGEHSSWQFYHAWFGASGDSFSTTNYLGKPAAFNEPDYPYFKGTDNHGVSDNKSSVYGPAPGIVPGGPNKNYSGTSIPPQNAVGYNRYYRDWADQSTASAVTWEISENSISYQGAYVALGAYYMTAVATPDTSPPNPDPMTWASAPAAVDASSITMTATAASDPSGPVEYQFACTAGGTGCSDSAWQTGTTYVATGLSPVTTYTYVVRARDAAPTPNMTGDSVAQGATTADYACSATFEIPANKWVFFSLPCTPPVAGASEIFSGGPASPDFNVTWVIAMWDSSLATPAWVYLAADEPMLQGKGYILYSLFAFSPANISGDFNSGGAIPLDPEAALGAWNLIGNPHIGTVNWTEVNVHDGTSSYTWAQMDQDHPSPNKDYWCDDEPANASCIMWRQMYKRVGYNTYDPYDGTGLEPGNLNTAEAMWVRSHRAVSLTFGPASASSSASDQADPLLAEGANSKPAKGGKDNKRRTEWQVRLVATSGTLTDRGNWLGQQEKVKDGWDARDLEEWTPFASPYLTILFTNPLFDEVDWGYTRDYRALTKKQQGEWPFVVRASSGITEVTLSWEGDDALFGNAQLVDEVSGEIITVVPDGSYTFSISGGEHAFRMVFQ